MSEKAPATARSYWKLIPGFAISAFFLWRTLRVIPFDTLKTARVIAPVWLGVLALALVLGYTTRIYRWWFMLRNSGAAPFAVCGRVLLTSFAANNILPFRIGDFLRVFAYADDLRASSSTILSTVILERLLDIFMLLLFLVVALLGAGNLPPISVHGHSMQMLDFAEPVMALCAFGLIVLLFGASLLQNLLLNIVRRFPAGPKVAKLEHWTSLLFDAVLNMSIAGRLLLLVVTVFVWACEGMIFVSGAHALGLVSGSRGPWLALSLSNLSYLLPSSPGAIGTFEYFAKLGMTSQGAPQAQSALYGLLVHVIVLFATTGAGGIAFFVHRSHTASKKSLHDEIEALPAEMP